MLIQMNLSEEEIRVLNYKRFREETPEPAIKEAEKRECYLFFCDAAHFVLAPFICKVWSLARKFVKASAGRNRINVLGTVNAITKEVITLINTTFIDASVIIGFRAIVEVYPKKNLYGKYYETPPVFHEAIREFFDTVCIKYESELKNLLTLKFQLLDNFNAQKQAA